MKFRDTAVIFLATGCYLGRVPVAPGTFGSLLGLLICVVLSDIWLISAVLITIAFIGCSVWIADEAEKSLNQEDPGCIVIDEIAGMMVTLIGLPFNLFTAAAGFILFRLLDILKPFPIRLIERRLSGGVGVVADDVAAGILANIVLRIVLMFM
jgi:phosphatidylglycerophosphatase A